MHVVDYSFQMTVNVAFQNLCLIHVPSCSILKKERLALQGHAHVLLVYPEYGCEGPAYRLNNN